MKACCCVGRDITRSWSLDDGLSASESSRSMPTRAGGSAPNMSPNLPKGMLHSRSSWALCWLTALGGMRNGRFETRKLRNRHFLHSPLRPKPACQIRRTSWPKGCAAAGALLHIHCAITCRAAGHARQAIVCTLCSNQLHHLGMCLTSANLVGLTQSSCRLPGLARFLQRYARLHSRRINHPACIF